MPTTQEAEWATCNMDVLTNNFEQKRFSVELFCDISSFCYRKPHWMLECSIQRQGQYTCDKYILLDHIHIYSTPPTRSASRDSCGCPWGRSLCTWTTWSWISQLLPMGPLHAVPTGNATFCVNPLATTVYQISSSIRTLHVSSYHKT
jgi:hypothetical protein